MFLIDEIHADQQYRERQYIVDAAAPEEIECQSEKQSQFGRIVLIAAEV